MKSSFDSGPGASNALGSLAREREALESELREEREKRDDELWALAVTELLVQRLPLPPPRPSAEASAAAPSRNEALLERDAGELGKNPAAVAGDSQSAAGRGEAAAGARGRSEGLDVPSELSAEVSDERLGRLQLHVARSSTGLDIVINVADSHVKALIEAEYTILIKTLKDAGLRVASVQIANTPQPGTALALDRAGAERARAGAVPSRPNARRRLYPASRNEENDDPSEGVDFTA